ncbi:protein kinase domain-containing protein, partial [Verrucomicrobium spinosum]|uniref:protein kinase domain-containing protein n=1 Tax=Verrucomicrobium spinosum TaxID=2736 RepID=UPI003CCE248F
MTMGTPDYVAPESLVMGVVADGRADLYSLGVMLYEMLTGQVPRGLHPAPSEVVPGLDKRLDAIVKRAMQHEPGPGIRRRQTSAKTSITSSP